MNGGSCAGRLHIVFDSRLNNLELTGPEQPDHSARLIVVIPVECVYKWCSGCVVVDVVGAESAKTDQTDRNWWMS